MCQLLLCYLCFININRTTLLQCNEMLFQYTRHRLSPRVIFVLIRNRRTNSKNEYGRGSQKFIEHHQSHPLGDRSNRSLQKLSPSEISFGSLPACRTLETYPFPFTMVYESFKEVSRYRKPTARFLFSELVYPCKMSRIC